MGYRPDLVKRVYEHKHKIVEGFTSIYNLNILLYYEVFDHIEDAIKREKQLKKWNREWKINLIKTKNPEFKDLYSVIL